MSSQWNAESGAREDWRGYQVFESTHDDEIEQLRPKQGRIERMVHSIFYRLRNRQSREPNEPPSYAGYDLRGLDFSRQDLKGADLTGADLRDANFTEANLEGAALAGVDGRGANFANAILSRCDLCDADLSRSSLIGTDFSNSSLQRANMGGSYMWGADFNGADVRDAVLSGAYAGGALFSHARNLSLEQFRSTIHDETGAYRLADFPEGTFRKRQG